MLRLMMNCDMLRYPNDRKSQTIFGKQSTSHSRFFFIFSNGCGLFLECLKLVIVANIFRVSRLIGIKTKRS